MHEAISKILRYTDGFSKQDFDNDDRTSDAVIRNFEIIGEAANHLSEELKDDFQNVDWFKIRGFRNRIVHQYFGIDYEIVWQLISTYIPELEKEIQKVRQEKKWT
jgi:uncharacterized protein with HEPN domain